MSVPVAEEWLWRRDTFANPLPLAKVWPKKSKAAGDRALAQRLIPAAFSYAFDRDESAYLAPYFGCSLLVFRIGY
jgi:hypothetical protein